MCYDSINCQSLRLLQLKTHSTRQSLPDWSLSDDHVLVVPAFFSPNTATFPFHPRFLDLSNIPIPPFVSLHLFLVTTSHFASATPHCLGIHIEHPITRMTTPTRRPSLRSSNSNGPSGSILRQLLDEINGTTTPTRRDTTSTTPRSLPSSRGSRSARTASIWVGGTDVAQDAREKLRAADEARHKKTSRREDRDDVRPTLNNLRLQIPSSRFITQPANTDNDIARANSPLMFVDSDISSTPSPSEEAPSSAVTVSSTDATTVSSYGSLCADPPRAGKRCRSPETTPRMITKKLRTMTLPATWDPAASFCTNAGIMQSVEFIERAAAPPSNPSSPQDQLPELSSFRPIIIACPDAPEAPPRPRTPTRPMTSTPEPPEPPETPSFARPLHLTDSSIVVAKSALGDEWVNDISIYKHVHGDEWKHNSLCESCFRRRGQFQRILTHGYESCGSYSALDSHFWEPTVGACMGEMDLLV
jgi:hypothetical protein